ncbi:hypothetical protein NMG60_11012737 [Bertholletia excelsa]
MSSNLLNTPKEQKENQSPFLEVADAEKQLLALIHIKGVLNPEVKDLYYRVRSGYEKLILNDNEDVELQDVEYSLWKLHYKHIDEFRKRIKQPSPDCYGTKLAILQNVISERFKSFLSEATDFYQNLIKKIRKCYGLPEDPLFYEKGGFSGAVEQTKLHECQYSCHRLFVCLGDLARYRELCKKIDSQRHNWSIAARYYFKATLVWPDSGNPQNQLALLATYIGDDFLALYHFVRSLAVKEPFPDVQTNLNFLFEMNRSSHLLSLSNKAHFNILNPYESSTSVTEPQLGCCSLNNDKINASDQTSCLKNDLWSLFVRMTSFFLLESSLEEFPCIFATTMKELDSLMALDDDKLKATLEAYQQIDSARTGPYRSLQIVAVLIFLINCMTESLQNEVSKEKNNLQQPTLVQLALTTTFICTGRLVGRCLRGNPLASPLLPAVLVFVEWLVGTVEKVDAYDTCEEVRISISYFFDTFVNLLNQLKGDKGECKYQDCSALWEDYELRGFAPVAKAHGSLDFTTHPKLGGIFDSRNICRASRIICAAMRIVDRSDDSPRWILYNNLAGKFYTKESKRLLDQKEEVTKSSSDPDVKELKGLQKIEDEANKENGKGMAAESGTQPGENGKSIATEEEEVILFRPITRYNSAPLSTSPTTDGETSAEDSDDHSACSDDCLRHATSLLIAQNTMEHNEQEPLSKDNLAFPAGPPSLNAWVLNNLSSDRDKEKGRSDDFKSVLSPIDEITSASLAGLSISEKEVNYAPYSPPLYTAPLPSAPLLPDDSTWFSRSSEKIKETDGILGPSPRSSYTNWSANHVPLSYAPSIYQPGHGMSSSEWLRQYTNQNMNRATNQAWPVQFYAPENFLGCEGSRYDFFDRWGNPLSPNRFVYLESPLHHAGSPIVHVEDEQSREQLLHNYQRPSPHGYATVTELGAEQPSLLQYLKEREWQLQRQPQVRGPAYMGN